MVLTKFPDLQWLKKQADESFEDRMSWSGTKLLSKGWPNVILNVSAGDTFRNDIRGPLSLFTNISGESTVTVGNRRVPVKEDLYFITNHGQYYSLEIKDHKPAETFNIHFGEFFCDQVYHSLSLKPSQLLDDHFEVPQERLEFHNKLYHRDDDILRLILEIKNHQDNGSAWLEEKLVHLIENFLKKESDLRIVRGRIPVLKSSTREEIMKRLLLVCDYIHAHLNEDISLHQLANVGCLSKFHFLRLFKIAFNATPYQFINDERIRRGKKMLEKSGLAINEIALSLGFVNPSSFSRMFFNHTGLYPTQLRR